VRFRTHQKVRLRHPLGRELIPARVRSGSEGARFTEATKINTSLLALGNVIQALAEKRSQIPYRDSKLTRMLGDRLGGHCRTSLLVCASPIASNSNETLRTALLPLPLSLVG
jgi:kinesin family protein 5